MPLPTKATVSRPLAEGYGALIEFGDDDAESLYLPLAVGPGRQMVLETVPPDERQSVDTGENPEDMRSESGQTFSRSAFYGGEGLDFAHRRDGTDRDWTRFWDSQDIDVSPAEPGVFEGFQLVRSTSSIRQGSLSVSARLVQDDGTLYGVVDDRELVDVSTNPTDPSPTWSQEDPGDVGTINDLALLGGDVYAARRSIRKRGAPWTLHSVRTVDGMWAVKSRIIASSGRQLWEIRESGELTGVTGEDVDDTFDVTGHGLSDGDLIRFTSLTGGSNLNINLRYTVANATADTFQVATSGIVQDFGSDVTDATIRNETDVLLQTLPSGSSWTDVVDAGAVIAASATDGNIYFFSEQDGDLVLATQQTVAPGETPWAMGYTQGLLFIQTATSPGFPLVPSIRLWRFTVADAQLSTGQVLRRWEGYELRSPTSLLVTRDSVWTSHVTAGDDTELWQYRLDTAGISRTHVVTASGSIPRVRGWLDIDGRLFFLTSGSTTSADLFREDLTYVDDGYLISPLGDFYNAAPKAWVGARLHVSDLPTDTTVTLAYSTDPDAISDPNHASWKEVITFDDPADLTDDETPITEVESRFIAGKVTLSANPANTETPRVLGFSFRGLSDITEDEYRIPVNLSDRREVPGRRAFTINGAGDALWDQLQSLKGQAATITILRPSEIIDGQIRGIQVPIDSLTPLRGSATVYGLLVVRGVHR